MTLRNILLAGTALGAAAFLAVPAQAGSKDCCGDVDALKQQINDLQQKVDDLAINYGNQIKDLQSRKSDVIVSMKNGAPTFSTADGAYTMTISGRFHLDVGTYSGLSDAERTGFGLGADAGQGNATFRRLILGVKGKFAKDWGYDLFFNFADSGGNPSGSIYEAALHYKGIKNVDVVWGAIQPILTLDDTVSSNDITFMERANANNLMTGIGASDGRMAFGVTGHGDNFYAGAYYTMDSKGSNQDYTTQNVVGRVAVAFHPDDASVVHLGASGTYNFDTKNSSYRFRERPEMRIDGGSFRSIDTGTITNIDNIAAYGPELAFAYGPVRAQAEYYMFDVNRDGANPDYNFNSWYVSASWVITGESYVYDMKKARFKGVKPADPFSMGGGAGAWEVAARYSEADLNDNGILGGDQNIWTFGLNWYPNNNVRFMLDYNTVEVKVPGATADFDQVGLRTQFKF